MNVYYINNTFHRTKWYSTASVIIHCNEVNEECSATDNKR